MPLRVRLHRDLPLSEKSSLLTRMARPGSTLILAGLVLGLGTPLCAEYSPELLERIDRPLEAEAIDLSPDGRYVAYSSRIGDRSGVVIVDLQDKVRRQLSMADGTNEARIVELRWATNERLIAEGANGDIFAIDADGANGIQLWDGTRLGVESSLGRVITKPEYRTTEDPTNRFQEALPPIMIPVEGDPSHLWIETSHRMVDHDEPIPNRNNLYTVEIDSGTDRYAWPEYLEGRRIVLYEEGSMLYDRTGQPRLYYWRPPATAVRRFRYVAPGEAPWQYFEAPPIEGLGYPTQNGRPPITLDEFLGQPDDDEFTVSATNYFGERSFPLAFGWDPNVFYYASNVGRDTFAIHSLNLQTRERTTVAALDDVDLARFEPEYPDRRLVFDESRKLLAGVRYDDLESRTLWLDPELEQVQQTLDRLFPGQNVEMRDWDDSRTRYLLRFSAEGQPGGYVLWQPANGSLEVLTPAAPWLEPDEISSAEAFEFDTEKGVRVTGYLTWPNESKVTPPPLLVYAPGGLWDRALPGFNREVQLLAAMGAAVLQVNYRGTAGFGREHLLAIQSGFETVPIDDILSAVEWAVEERQFNPNRVLIMGEHFGGYLALRALEQHSERFRAAILVNSPTRIDSWTVGSAMLDPARKGVNRAPISLGSEPPKRFTMPLEFMSTVRANLVQGSQRLEKVATPDGLELPVLIFEDPGSPDTTPMATTLGSWGFGLSWAQIQRVRIDGDLVNGTPETREKTFTKIAEFLNQNFYDPNVKVGPLEVIPDETEPARENLFE